MTSLIVIFRNSYCLLYLHSLHWNWYTALTHKINGFMRRLLWGSKPFMLSFEDESTLISFIISTNAAGNNTYPLMQYNEYIPCSPIRCLWLYFTAKWGGISFAFSSTMSTMESGGIEWIVCYANYPAKTILARTLLCSILLLFIY